MAYNKFVTKDGKVFLDLTSDDITAQDVRHDKIFHGRDGNEYIGTLEDGIEITKTEINSDGELVITFSNDVVNNLGKVIGPVGQAGKDGKDGIDGKDGVAGVDGKTPYIKDGYWWIDTTNTLIKAEGIDGKEGPAGIDGKTAFQYAQENGYTGTEDEFAASINPSSLNNKSLNYIATELAKRDRIIPEYVNSIEECTDKTKVYVLPDGYIYGYLTEQNQEVFVDVLKDVGFSERKRINSSGVVVDYTTTESDVTGYIPAKVGDVIRLRNIVMPGVYTEGTYWNIVSTYRADKTFIKMQYLFASDVAGGFPTTLADEDGNLEQFTITSDFTKDDAEVAFILIDAKDITKDSKIYVNSTLVHVDTFANTGHAFIPADYEDRIIDLENEVVNLGVNAVPAYWEEELVTKADMIQEALENAGRNKSAFLWYTDAHWLNNSKKSPILLKYLTKNTPINKVNFGGDIVNDPVPHNHANTKYVYEWRKMVADLPNHHSVFGNHDVNQRSTNVSNIAYTQLLAEEETPEMVVGGDSFYYIDDHAEKTRYLYLSYLTNNQTEMLAQGQFITEALTSVSAGWHIVVIAHRWFQYTASTSPTVGGVPAFEAEILKVLDEYNARASHTASNYFPAKNFSDSKGKVEFCIGGHIHVDYDFKTDGGIPVIITASDTNQERVPDKTEDSGTIGTTTEAAIYGIIADYANNKISVIGIGRGGSREIEY